MTTTIEPLKKIVGLHTVGLALCITVSCFVTSVSAEQVADILIEESSLVLDNQTKVRLAGIKLPSESRSALATLVNGKDIEINYLDPVKPGDSRGLVYVTAYEMPMPFPQGQRPNSSRILLNEVLIELGLAQVNEEPGIPFAEWQQAEMMAKARGDGLWSYEPFTFKKNHTEDALQQRKDVQL